LRGEKVALEALKEEDECVLVPVLQVVSAVGKYPGSRRALQSGIERVDEL